MPTALAEDCGCTDTLQAEVAPTDVPAAGSTSVFWEGALGMEGELTGDGRFIEHGALTWDLPMLIRYVSADVGEHGGAVVAGRILAVERRPGGVIYGYGDFDMNGPNGIEAERQVREELTNGVSMDLDDVAFEVRVAQELVSGMTAESLATAPVGPDGKVTVATIKPDDEVRATTSARMRAATIVAIPAFASARIGISANPPTLPTDVAPVAQLDTEGLSDYADAEVAEPTGLDENGECITDENDPDYVEDCVPATQKVKAPGRPASLAASALATKAYPIAPPSAWFQNPQFKMASPLTITKEGRIFGHLAAWGVCHIGMAHSGCVTAPKSRSGYAYFHTGSIVTAESTEVPIGHITLDTTHAPTVGLSAAGAQNHYEVTGHAVADVVVGEDRHGIWVSGALRPGISPAQLRALRAAPLSGDWRRVAGNLELVAALAVNVPGFPIPRPQGLVAGGVVQALVASGMVPPKQVLRPGTEGALSADDLKYLKRLAAREREAERLSLQASARPDPAELARRVQASALSMRVNAGVGS